MVKVDMCRCNFVQKERTKTVTKRESLNGKQNARSHAYSLTWGVRLVVAAWALVGGAASPVHACTLVWQNADPPPSTKAGAYAEYVL